MNTKNTYTAGPLEYHTADNAALPHIAIEDATGRRVADVYSGEADAILFAAAPELLEALVGLETAFDKWYCDSGHLCALLDGMKKEDATPAMKDEVLRLQNLIIMSVKARTAIAHGYAPAHLGENDRPTKLVHPNCRAAYAPKARAMQLSWVNTYHLDAPFDLVGRFAMCAHCGSALR